MLMLPPAIDDKITNSFYDTFWTGRDETETMPSELGQFTDGNCTVFLIPPLCYRSTWRDIASAIAAVDRHRAITHIVFSFYVSRCQSAGVDHLIRAMKKCSKPIIGHVQFALGASLIVLSACDYRTAQPNSRLGLLPDWCYLWQDVPKVSPLNTAKLWASEVDGREAETIGLVDSLVPDLSDTVSLLQKENPND